MRVCEIFESIIGEGRFMGCPSLFIRTYGCNLNCINCDTNYAKSGGEYIEMSIQKLLQLILLNRHKYVVITGGEPLLQFDELFKLSEIIWERFYLHDDNRYHKYLLLETNGTKTGDCDLLSVYFERITVSPKKNYQRVNEVIEYWETFGNVDFKFVIGSLDWTWTLDEIQEILKTYNLDPDRIYLMPEGGSSQDLNRLAKEVWEFCVKNGLNYSDRLHIRVWGNVRGK